MSLTVRSGQLWAWAEALRGEAGSQRCAGQLQKLATLHVFLPESLFCRRTRGRIAAVNYHSLKATSRALRTFGSTMNSSSKQAISRKLSDSGRCTNTSGSPRDSSMARRM